MTKFESEINSKGIPFHLYNKEKVPSNFLFSTISEICSNYPLHEVPPPSLSSFFINHIVSDK